MPPPDPDAVPAYRLASPVPDYWYPMPADGGSDGARLELQLLPDADTGIVEPPRGRLLGAGLQVREEEIGRDGVEIARVPRRARWTDGTTHAWVARRRAVGRGEGSSGLRFDRLQ